MNAEMMTLHTDKYQINMMYAHWVNGTHKTMAVFDAYFRKLPFGNGYAVFAGLERIVNYIKELHFDEAAIEYLSTLEEQYDPAFLDELRNFRFTGNILAVKEGTVVFPNEPLIRVEARLFEAQLVETAMLNFMNFQTLIATKASRIRRVVGHDTLLEFGTRRAQEADAAIWGARAAYIGGFNASSNMLAGQRFGIPTKGTHAHAWVQSFHSEEEAFMKFAKALPNQVSLLVDTYDTLKSGVPHAIEVGHKLARQGKKLQSIRLDSGDLAYLSIRAREMLDDAGLSDVKIIASNDLDENTIADLKAQGARVDIWGVGTQLITAADQPALGGVYKIVALEVNGEYEPTIKISGNPEKVTTPGKKLVYRIVDRNRKKAIADYISLDHEQDVNERKRIKLFDPQHPYLHRYVQDYDAQELLTPIFVAGEQVYELPTLEDICAYHAEQIRLFWPEVLRKLNPHEYHVDLSLETWQMKNRLLEEHMVRSQ